MPKKEEFKMFAVYENVPYIVKKENIKTFLSKSKEQEGIAENKAKMFNKSDFDFKKDKDGFFSVTIDTTSFGKKGVEKS